MEHARENGTSADLEPMQRDQSQGTKTERSVHCATNKDDTNNKEEALKTNKLSCGSVHSVHESLVDVLMSFHMLQVIPHDVGLVALYFVTQIQLLSTHQLIHI